MSNATKLHAFTLALQAQFATAAELRIRRATRGVVTVFQLIGNHPKHGKIGRKIPATSEEELLAFGLLIDGRELVIREAELPAAHLLSPGLRSRLHCRAEGLGFQESP